MPLRTKERFILTLKLLAVAFGLFLMLFSLDVFGEGSFVDQLLGFLIHSLPSFAILIAVALFWKKPTLIGSFMMAVAVFLTVRFKLYSSLPAFASVSLPAFLIGLGLVAAGWEKPR